MKKIESVWMFIAVDKVKNEEGVIAAQNGNMLMPFVATDERRRDALRQKAAEISHESGMQVQLIRLTTREDLEIITPIAPLIPMQRAEDRVEEKTMITSGVSRAG